MWQQTFKIKSVLWTLCFLCLIYVKTTLSCYPKKKYTTKRVGCVILLTYVEHSFFLLLPLFILLHRALSFHIVIYSRSLRTTQTHLHHRLHPVWSLSSFSTGSRQRKRKGVGTKTTKRGAHIFSHLATKLPASPAVRCCGAHPGCWGASSAAVRAAAWCCYRGAESRGRGQHSSGCRPTGCFKQVCARSWQKEWLCCDIIWFVRLCWFLTVLTDANVFCFFLNALEFSFQARQTQLSWLAPVQYSEETYTPFVNQQWRPFIAQFCRLLHLDFRIHFFFKWTLSITHTFSSLL